VSGGCPPERAEILFVPGERYSARVEPAGSVESLLVAPVGHYLVGEGWLYFYPTARVSGFVLWGNTSGAAVREATRITPLVHAHREEPHVALVDARRVEKVEPEAFAHAVGCASLHHFTALFKKSTGETPSRWREQRRSAGFQSG
jgi:hypothetical protein